MKIRQIVYFHNALFICEKKFSLFESFNLWFYQNIIGKIIKNNIRFADEIIVQAEWIKRVLIKKWAIDANKIRIEKPQIESLKTSLEYKPVAFFYPANGLNYKNHITLLKALIPIWEINDGPELRLTVNENDLTNECKALLKQGKFPISFLGRLTREEMINEYKSSILVFPSYIETIGLPLIEAKDLGCLIIASDCEYAHDALGEYTKVKYFSPFQPETLSEILLEFKKYLEIPH